MKKIIYLISLFGILSFGYYFISFYPYLNRMEEIIKKIDSNNLEIARKDIFEEKRKTLIISQQNISINSLLRRQAMMSVYNDFVVDNRHKKFKGLWRIDRLFWSYLSYLHFSNNDIFKIYLYYNYR